mgnify:CR=1 FL=1
MSGAIALVVFVLCVLTGAVYALAKEVRRMSENLDVLTAQVAATNGVSESAVVAINGLADKIDALIAAGNSDPALAALAADLKAKSDALAAAIAENPVP